MRVILDEAGTPGDKSGLFVTAGVAIRGEVSPVERSWNLLCESQAFPTKARKYKRDSYLDDDPADGI